MLLYSEKLQNNGEMRIPEKDVKENIWFRHMPPEIIRRHFLFLLIQKLH